jgi:predicted permease
MVQDLRYAVRLLLKDRTFTLTALLTLTLCIGANTAIFSIVRSVLLRPLPVPHADRIMQVYNSYPNAGAGGIGSVGVPDYFDRRRDATAFEEHALYRSTGVTLGSEEGAERLAGVSATPSFYRLIDVKPALGRIFTDDEGEIDRSKAVILSDGLWHRRFGGDPSILGRDIRLNGTPYNVVGVMKPDFLFLSVDVELWLPQAFTAQQKSDDARHSNNFQGIGLLKPGATLQLAQQQVDAINARNDERFPNFRQILHDAGFHTVVVPLQEAVVSEIRPTLYLLWGGVLFVLLLGCVNLANLVLVRSAGRTRELATRQAVGADIGRLGRQLLTETTLLSLVGGGTGLAAGALALRAITSLHLEELPRAHEIRLDPVGAAAILGLAVGVGLLVGLVPVMRLSRMNVNSALREDGRGGTSGRVASVMRRTLAMAQVAIAFVLLVGAGLLVASFREVLHINPGFEPAGVVTAYVSLPGAAYKDDAAAMAFTTRMLTAVRALPGVEAAGVTTAIPFGGNYSDSVILAEGYQMKPGESLISPLQQSVSDGYMEAMRMPLAKGRYFTDADTANSTRVAIVDERLAAKFWPGRDPIGRRLHKPESAKDVLTVGPNTKYITVVGVVKELQMRSLVPDDHAVGAYYFPDAQEVAHGMALAVRSRGSQDALVGELRKVITAIDAALPLYQVRTMTDRLDNSLVSRRVPMMLAIAFGVVALFLSAIGVYGVLAYGVSQRRREIGVRMALGGTPGAIFGLVIGDGVKIVLTGLLVGLGGAFVAGRAMTSLLYGVRPADPTVLATIGAVLLVVALVATAIPARRASKVNPIVALGD